MGLEWNIYIKKGVIKNRTTTVKTGKYLHKVGEFVLLMKMVSNIYSYFNILKLVAHFKFPGYI